MKDPGYWRDHYVVETDVDEIERHLKQTTFVSNGKERQLIFFEQGSAAPNVLISPGSGGHSYVFAELAYQMHLHGYNVFVMPKQGGFTISRLVARHVDAVDYIAHHFNDRIGIFAEGFGGYATFYFALAHGPATSIVYQNSPAILTEPKFHAAMSGDSGAARRRGMLLPLMKVVVRVVPKLSLPISLYLDLQELVDTREANHRIEAPRVAAFLNDPDFDTHYPLEAIMSLVMTPPPNPLTALLIPTMFLVPVRGLFPAYLRDLYDRLPPIKKHWLEVDGGVYWMCSHPKEAASAICGWFEETV